MKQKLVAILALFAAMTVMTGIAGAATETINSINEGNNINTTVGNLAKDKFYQLRYYPPNTFPCNTGSASYSCDDNISSNPLATGHINGSEWCTGDDPITGQSKCNFAFNSTHFEIFQPNIQGVWAIGLFHGGQGGTAITSFKVSTKIDIPIPEFPTIALPIAAVLGLVFFFHFRKDKEE